MALPFRTAVCAAAASSVLVSGCSLEVDSGVPSRSGEGARASSGSALAAVDDLTVKGRSPKTGYDRSRFGSPWVDTDGNGCGTRDDILERDLTEETFRADGTDGTDACVVTSGILDDPYTGKRIRFVRGRSRVDIDHAVALSDAWQKGAQRWTRDKRVQFANDPLNLLAVSASANRGKGDGDAATWLPPNKSFRCDYVARQVAVKKKYGVRVTRAERDAMLRVLNRCPGHRLPAAKDPVR